MTKRMGLAMLAVCCGVLLPASGHAQPAIQSYSPAGTYLDGSRALSTTPTQVFGATPRVRIKLLNNSGVGSAGGTSIVIWCRWGTVGAAPAAAGGAGSFALQPGGGGLDDQGAGVNQSALNCLSESGTPTLYAEQY